MGEQQTPKRAFALRRIAITALIAYERYMFYVKIHTKGLLDMYFSFNDRVRFPYFLGQVTFTQSPARIM